ncbi:FAD/NAD(P)-binding domain-containing protein [Annulohypoxylon maeteangense]|uniref:FAD/NAD(P)-binding domain-containing protein n=1 Tax=Annulohypoxylon maeteangense TaxID=1927788 RepID=UPI002008B47B|nr:FAD/NAD(P)-binding domain-containing protein [Annulohypoxylon maeteangense]KAI0885924.1 FAD/NAD(P)-binding domain-containing protein [Annulohypoxylon maeteangense]
MSQQPIRIIGAGIGGLTLGRCLLKHGVPAVLYERMPSTPRHGYGITLHASSYRPLLEVLGLDEWTFRRRIAVDGSVGGSGNIDPELLVYPGKIDPSSSFRAHREKLEKLLRQGLDVQWENALEKVEETPSGVALCLQSTQKLESTCVIGVDGPHSNTRKSLSPNTPLKVLPYVAFNGKRHVKRALFDEVYAPAIRGSNLVETRLGDVVLTVFVNEKQADAVNVGWTYSRPARGSTDMLHKPNRPVSGATDIPEEFFQEIEALQELRQPFKEIFDAEKLRMERVLHWLMRTVLVSHQELCTFVGKGVFFMGDSVHAEPILGGEGAENAIIDGIELAKCISTHGPAGIRAWYDSRYPTWESSVKESERAIEKMHGGQKVDPQL